MKTLMYALISLMFQQVEPILSPEFVINENITEVRKNEILYVVQSTLNKYFRAGDFWNKEKNEFDNEKYDDFITLFAGNAQVVDDISFTKELMNYSEYAEKIFDKLHENGVPFRIERAYVNRIDIDESGFYVIDVSFKKRLFSGLNENDKPVELKKGRIIHLNMRIDLPDYLLSDARIQYIQHEKNNKILDLIKKPLGYVSEFIKRKN